MPRKGAIRKREILPDPKYKDIQVARFINTLLRRGKKSIAEGVLYDSLDIIQKNLNKDPLDVFRVAIRNVRPMVEVKSRRVGGATYQVPMEIRPTRQESLAIRWLITYSKTRSEKSMEDRLAAELIDAYNKRGVTVKKRDDTHRMAEANKAFAHYRW